MCVEHGQHGAKSFSVAANNYAVALAAVRFGTTHRAPGFFCFLLLNNSEALAGRPATEFPAQKSFSFNS